MRALCLLPALAVCLAAPAFAAAPAALDDTAPASPSADAPVIKDKLDTEMTVKNWVLCVSQSLAEQIVRAREESVENAEKAYASLAAARSCGRFAELRVILKEPLYHSAPAAGYDAQVYGALVNLSGSWANAFVIEGGLPEAEK